MKYIITAKNIQDEPHVTDPYKRTEIATELISTRMKALIMLDKGEISVNDTIVTRIDRKCLYDSIFNNVIDWNDFYGTVNHVFASSAINSGVIDLANEICDGSIDSRVNFDKVFPVIPENIFNISFCDLALYRRPFICVLIRSIPNDSQKNLINAYWIDFINKFISKTNSSVDIFIFGFDFSLFTATHPIGNVIPVNSFKGWCSLLSNKNCKAVISTCSGGVYPLFFVGNSKSRLYIIDNKRLTVKHKDSPSFYNDCINFKNIGSTVYLDIPPINLLIEDIKEDAGI